MGYDSTYDILVDILKSLENGGGGSQELLNKIKQLETQVAQLTNDVSEKQAFIDTATGVTITENGTYAPEEGVVGWNEVIVNVEGGGSIVTDPLPVIDNPNKYFYIQTVKDNNTIYFYTSNTNYQYSIYSHLSKLEYSYDGTTWTSLNGVKTLPLESYGDYIFIRNTSTSNISFPTVYSLFGAEYPVKVGGNVQKFLSNYANPTSVNYSNLFAVLRVSGNYIYNNIAYFDIEIPNGTSVSRMFQRKEEITTLPTIERLSISGTGTASSFEEIFYETNKLVVAPQINTSNGTNFTSMFFSCKVLAKVPLLDTSNGTDFTRMFAFCGLLTENGIPQLNTSKGTNFSNMFNFCSNLTTIPQLDTSNGTNFGGMFQYCSKLTSIPLLDTSKGTDFRHMFGNCTSLTTIPQLDTSNGTDFNGMFSNCINLTNITLTGSINKDIDFSHCKKLTYDSVKSILTACAATTNTDAKTLKFNRTLTDNNGELAALVTTCTSKGWTVSGLTLN